MLSSRSEFYDFMNSEEYTRIRILSTWWDEAHIFARSGSSARLHLLRQFCARSEFNVIITGTLFPLGPCQDAGDLLVSLGGGFGASEGRWKYGLGTHLGSVFNNPDSQARRTASLLTLRALMAPFTLRRTLQSLWDGEWIINRGHVRSDPEFLRPLIEEGDQTEEALVQEAQRLFRRRGKEKETQQQREKRANDQRFYALAPLYSEILERSGHGNEDASVPAMEEVIKSKFRLSKPTPRMKTFMRWVKGVRQRGKKFIIVCDRIFPLVLAHYVFCFLAILRLRKQVARGMGYKVGNLTGTKMWNQPTSDRSRNEVVRHLNSGSLHGIVMTAQVGACGHNLTGASRMIFMGSLYSKAYEDQAVGMFRLLFSFTFI